MKGRVGEELEKIIEAFSLRVPNSTHPPLHKGRRIWKMVIQLIVSVLTAVATTLGVTSCV